LVEEPKPNPQLRKLELLLQLDRRVSLLKMAAPALGQERDVFDREIAAIREGLLALEALELEHVSEEPRRWWFIELWFEKRELFKEFMGEVFFIISMLVALDVIHRLIATTTLEPYQITLLSKAHFYITFASLGILSFGFIITIAKSLRGKAR